ncbi:MAG: efflux RND transporter periplasmic adaptor subunit, partial [Desulfovibrio sp.]|nr:efflux RND transporter periplasmic adaptor subunit [Desulfovibrio sp.]
MTTRPLLYLPLILVFCLALVACSGDKNAKQGPMHLPVAVFDVEVKDHPWPAEYQAQASGSRAVEVRSRVEAIIEKRL